MTFKPTAKDPKLELKENLAPNKVAVVEIQRRPTKTLKIPSLVETNPVNNLAREINPDNLPEAADNLRIPSNKQTPANQEAVASSQAPNRSPNNPDRVKANNLVRDKAKVNNLVKAKDRVSSQDKDKDKDQAAKLLSLPVNRNHLAVAKGDRMAAAEVQKASLQVLTTFYANSQKAKMELANPPSPDVGLENGQNVYAPSKNL